ncbi:transketolase-like TK C-terminal-containing protein [Nocardioides marmotae]|uniref:transketolase-like TK C-terminal-containing protein n=1 Tax=Nocardioides marmotae TaxID=2663857 RepID=UPI0012B5EB15|nr:pyruvate dehydrogenase [Nocardioides marmotae]MBC9732804.1 pyruvate dehydrogenase [Nocardioides marmotae]MTB83918.1 pyruvate dehydrogenase [Nocardioides marmotae]
MTDVPTRPGSAGTAPTDLSADGATASTSLAVLEGVERQVLWLSTAMVHHANNVRPNPGGLKVGGHQASSASMVSIMTTLWLRHLRSEDRVSVKPHASPVLHALEYVLGQLPASKLTTLREFGGLQSYPSRTKDLVPSDYSTGSVGIGATAPVWGALARRYVDAHFAGTTRGRQYSLLGDAELDEGACWEAILDPMVSGLGEVVWIVDFNRQSLDRIVPTLGSDRMERMFRAAGWQVITVKYGYALEALFALPGGDGLRRRIDTMSNAEYQRLLRHDADQVRALLPGDGPDAEAIRGLLLDVDDNRLVTAVRNLGGHDLAKLDAAFDAIDDSVPTAIIAYTVKGRGLPTEGHPQNHSALLTEAQMLELAERVGADLGEPWRLPPDSDPTRALCREAAARLVRAAIVPAEAPAVPSDLGRVPAGTGTTQAALGRTLLDLSREAPEVGSRIVTVTPDVSSSTNLGGWVNKMGVWAADEQKDWFADDRETILHWRERPNGQHIELGIAETNLVGLISELGTTWDRWGQPLLPIGVVYDPFVNRALEPWSFGIYAGGQSILVGTPSGVTLAPEGGAHQSITTPSTGIEQPGCTTWEPAFAQDTEWCLLAALSRIGRPGGSSAYLRLSTRPVDQTLAEIPLDPAARDLRRRQVVAGGYPLKRRPDSVATIVAVGALTPEALAAEQRLAALGSPVDIVCLTSPDLIFRAHQSRRGLGVAENWILSTLFPHDAGRPLVTVLDGHPHTLAFLSGVTKGPAAHLGVSRFGQSGDLESTYRYHGIDTDSIVRATLEVLG